MSAFRHQPGEVTVASAGWAFSGLAWPTLDTQTRWEAPAGQIERLVVPWSGGCTVTATRGERQWMCELHGRADGWAGPTDAAYVPPGWAVQITASQRCEVAVGSAVASAADPGTTPYCLSGNDVVVEQRGEGAAARTIRHYAPRTPVPTQRLLLCEVITRPGGWSSFPPHKHDEHQECERALEEIYAFKVRPTGVGGGFPCAYLHTGEGESSQVWPVSAGDIVCVPSGYHGPAMAPPGVELYYLNVMAGAAHDRQWLVTYHPSFT